MNSQLFIYALPPWSFSLPWEQSKLIDWQRKGNALVLLLTILEELLRYRIWKLQEMIILIFCAWSHPSCLCSFRFVYYRSVLWKSFQLSFPLWHELWLPHNLKESQVLLTVVGSLGPWGLIIHAGSHCQTYRKVLGTFLGNVGFPQCLSLKTNPVLLLCVKS